MVHGFSVGGYVWAEALVQIEAERHRYQHIFDRIAGQVWDSLADITEISEGFPFAVFPKNKVLQGALKQYILYVIFFLTGLIILLIYRYHLKTFDKVATCHYVRASQMFHTNIVRAPALFFLSKTDPIGSERSNLRARENWESMGIQVNYFIIQLFFIFFASFLIQFALIRKSRHKKRKKIYQLLKVMCFAFASAKI